jgi:hypothetical protein
VRHSRKAVNGRLQLTVYGRTCTVPVPYKMVSQCLTVRVRNRIYGPCLRKFTARLQALDLSNLFRITAEQPRRQGKLTSVDQLQTRADFSRHAQPTLIGRCRPMSIVDIHFQTLPSGVLQGGQIEMYIAEE